MTFHVEPLIAVTITNPGVYIIGAAIVFCLVMFTGCAIHGRCAARKQPEADRATVSVTDLYCGAGPLEWPEDLGRDPEVWHNFRHTMTQDAMIALPRPYDHEDDDDDDDA